VLGLCLALVFALTATGRGTSWDGTVMLGTSFRLWREHRWDIDLRPGALPRALGRVPPNLPMIRRDGLTYQGYGPAFSLLALPLVATASVLERATGTRDYDFIVYFINSFVIAAMCALTAAIALELGATRVGALWAAVLLGFGTFAWPYARYDLSDPLLSAALAGSVLHTFRFERTQRLGEAAIAGAWAGLALATKITAAITFPVIGAALLVAVTRHRSGLRPVVAVSAAFGFPLAVAIGGLLAYNAVRLGTAFARPYGGVGLQFFNHPMLAGIYGLLLSPFGLFRHAPVALLWPLALWRMVPTNPLRAGVSAAFVAVHVLFFSKYFMWPGGPTTAPRFLTPVLPLVAAIVAAYLRSPLALGAVLAAGALVNLRWVLAPRSWVVTQSAVPLPLRVTAVGVLLVAAFLTAAWVWRRRVDQTPARS
jgi:hypothetical protein